MQKSCRERVAAPEKGADLLRAAACLVGAPGTYLSCADSEHRARERSTVELDVVGC
jgi:hypothetical protein